MQQNLQYLKFVVSEALRILFLKNNRSIEHNPPIKANLKEHILKTNLQSSMWHQTQHKFYDNRNPCFRAWQQVSGKL